MFDSHIHTKFSSDSKMDIKEVIDVANKNNIKVTITDHMDLNFPIKGRFLFDMNEYFNEYSKYKNDNLFLGVELGMRPDCLDENIKISQNYPLDFIIGSVHVVDNMDIYLDEYYNGKSKKESYEQYLNFMLQCVKLHDCIDTLGHIDYISRYARYNDKEMYYKDYSEIIDEILKILIEKEKAIEINTRRFEDKGAIDNLLNIYKRYKELGGKNVTIGSDAHNAQTVGSGCKTALEIAETCGLKPVYFRNRKIEYL